MEGDITPKLKIVYLMKILEEKTDEDHPITLQEILSRLEEYGITAERKSIYRDIESLRTFGLDIVKVQKDKNCFYYLGARRFELAELKLLVDSVQAARFITHKKSTELIKKIEGLASHYEASQLQRQVFVTERVKSGNEQILYNVDSLHKAIAENSRITFRYFHWNVHKKKEFRHDGELYAMSPWALTLADENYYLVCYDEAADRIKYFRVDKMQDIALTGQKRAGREEFKRFDVASYAKKRFNMYDGEERTVKLRCSDEYAGVIIDRFGNDVMLHPAGTGFFTVNVDVAVSNQFIGWVLSMNDGMEIVEPADVVAKTKEAVERMAYRYGVKE